jgi:hypothetical protein
MKCFIALEEDLIMRLWMQDPSLVMPFSRPFITPSQLARWQEEGLNASKKIPLNPPLLKGEAVVCQVRTESFE